MMMRMTKIFKSKKILKRYYREWLGSHGWGVMMDYDTVMAYSKDEARSNKPYNMYAYDKSFEYIGEVKSEHLHMTDQELSKLYGEQT